MELAPSAPNAVRAIPAESAVASISDNISFDGFSAAQRLHGEVRGVLPAAASRAATPGTEAAAEADVPADVAGGWGPAGAPSQQHAAQPHGEVPQQVNTRQETLKGFSSQRVALHRLLMNMLMTELLNVLTHSGSSC